MDEGWILVTSKKPTRHYQPKNKKRKPQLTMPLLNSKPSPEAIQHYIDCLSTHHTTPTLTTALQKLVSMNAVDQIEVECLGLGNFSLKHNAAVQMLFLRHVIVPTVNKQQQSIPKRLNIYDPIFTAEQKQECRLMHATVECAKFYKPKTTAVVYFLPHCQRDIYQELLDALSEHPRPCIVIGNSVKSYIERCELIGSPVPRPFLRPLSHEELVQDIAGALTDTFLYEIEPLVKSNHSQKIGQQGIKIPNYDSQNVQQSKRTME